MRYISLSNAIMWLLQGNHPTVNQLSALLQIEWVFFPVFCPICSRSVAPHYREVLREDAKHSLSIDGTLSLLAWAARAVNPRSPQGYAGGVRG